MKVRNIESAKGNKIANQFILEDGNKTVFQSYNSKIATWDGSTLYLNGEMWDYSHTTRKYFALFVEEETNLKYKSKKEFLKLIEQQKDKKIFIV